MKENERYNIITNEKMTNQVIVGGIIMKPEDIKEYLLRRCNRPLGKEEGILFGDPYIEIRNILVTWMATLDAIEEAIRKECNFILCHEALFYPYVVPEGLGDVLSWRTNRKRLELLAKNGITVFRAHGLLDYLLITEYFGKTCNLGEPVAKEEIAYIYQVAPIILKDFARSIKSSMNLPSIRMAGDPEKEISRIGIAVGGMGLFVNIGFWEILLKYNVDVILVGETDEYAIRYALDSGVAVVETTHPSSENPGLKKFSEELARDFPDVKVYFYDVGNKWIYIT